MTERTDGEHAKFVVCGMGRPLCVPESVEGGEGLSQTEWRVQADRRRQRDMGTF